MAYIWRETFSNIRHSGIVGFMSIVVVVLTTVVLSTLLMIVNYVNAELSVLKETSLITVFLKADLEDDSRESLQGDIRSFPEVRSVRYIPKDEALRKAREMFADRVEVLEGLEQANPLPTSIEIELKAQFLVHAKNVVARIRDLPGVDDVQYAEKTPNVVRTAETTLVIIGSILGLSSIAIICFSVMLTAYIRRDEIRIMRLVGATGPFIRLPLLLQGIIQGIIGSVAGLAILYGLFRILSVRMGVTAFIPTRQMVSIVSLGAFIGFVGGAFPLRRLVRI